MAKITICGNLGGDAVEHEVTVGDQVKFVTKFTVAESEYKGKDAKGEFQYSTTWFNVTLWNNESHADRIKFLKKGNHTMVIGDYKARLFQADDKSWRISNDITIRSLADVNSKEILKKEDGSNGSTSVDF